MATNALNKPNKVVVACLDGRRLKGQVFNFTLDKDRFHLFPEEGSAERAGSDITFDSLKAIFFVKDFVGDPKHVRVNDPNPQKHGRAIEVIFKDGEKVVGTTEAYNPQKIGFFMSPFDSEGNNTRMFIVKKNVREVKMITAAAPPLPMARNG